MGKVMAGALLLLIALAAGGYFFAASGRFPVAATAAPDVVDTIAPWALQRAIEHQAKGAAAVAVPKGEAAVARGLGHYRENCLPCHGAPGAEAAEFAQVMSPAAPGIDSPIVQNLSDAQLVWVVKNGIRMTGMPAFGSSHKDAEIADIVAFVRQLPHLTPEEKAKLHPPEAGDHHHDAEEHHHDHE